MFLSTIHLLPALLFWLSASLLHLKFSLFLVEPLDTFWGSVKLKNYASYPGYATLGLLMVFIYWYFVRHFFSPANTNKKKHLISCWVVWTIGVALINFYLLATSLENIHFVQYAVIAVLFIWAYKPSANNLLSVSTKTLFWVSLFGIIDEVMQYVWITASYSQHLDFNDFILNLMGTIGGILAYLSVTHLTSKRIDKKALNWNCIKNTPEIRISLLLIVIFYTTVSMGYIQFSTVDAINPGGFVVLNSHTSLFFERSPNLLGNWNKAFNGGQYYILSALEGSLLFLMVALSFYWLCLRSLLYRN